MRVEFFRIAITWTNRGLKKYSELGAVKMPETLATQHFSFSNTPTVLAFSLTYMEVVTLTLELSRSVDFVCHDSGDGLLDILHPFNHLGLTHDVDILDERIVLLPERHFE